MDSPKAAVNLETELTCSICTDLLYQPLTLLDCLHTFCAACLKEWFHWQAVRAENAPTPPLPDAAVFTCPSCRERVRDTRHDARVTTLLEMFLALNPDKAKSDADRAEMDQKYKKGDKIMPKLSFQDRTPEQRRLDAQERRLLEEVQQMSLRDAVADAAAAANSSHASSRTRRRDGADSRSSREPSRSRDPSRDSETRGTRESARRRAEGATLQADNVYAEERRRRRSESRQRHTNTSNVRARYMNHQSSLRSLISSEGVEARDVEREIEEFARQIQEEGLLEGLDLDNIDLANNTELSRKITEAYRRRHRERLRNNGGRSSNASAHSHRSEVATRPRSRTGDSSRPSSRHAAHSREPSASSTEERGRYPPSASGLLEVQEPARRRRRMSSGTRSATVPIGPTQPDIRAPNRRSQTDLSTIVTSAGQNLSRPRVTTDIRSVSSPTVVTSAGARVESPAAAGQPFHVRAAAGLGISQPQPDPQPDPSASNRKRAARPAELALGQGSPNLVSISGPFSTDLVSPPLSSPRRAQMPRYKEPFISCSRCSREHIEYELHYNCSICSKGGWNICQDCWRQRKGCLNWYGFGNGAWKVWENAKASDPQTAPPHILAARRYTPPKAIPGGAEGRRTLTTDNPIDRLQTGSFCSGCLAWANDGFWRCDSCNEGEWGFCGDCVNQGVSCSHPLVYQSPSASSVQSLNPTPPTSPSPKSPVFPRPSAPTVVGGPSVLAVGNQKEAALTPPCEVCRKPIQSTDPRLHCYSCTSKVVPDPRPGDYNICQPCYSVLASNGIVAPENGPAGWRRCPQGHRMVVVGFELDEKGGDMRRILRESVGGRRLRSEPYAANPSIQVFSWWNTSAGDAPTKLERLVALDVSVVAAAGRAAADVGGEQPGRFTDTFPADGGTFPRAVAKWSWYPAAGADDELMFPKGAEVLEVENVNDEWFHGYYMGASGLFPGPYVKLVRRDDS
ncbi:hypothetical protein B0T26DRAFT_720272 [Lasiosphaeria miniovina]|uniref:E3 ubiquitin-protein ligase CHFR n=1 Tax=Lasiosphaeria miniovina TaxID=1954250 RepID=A0AA40A4D2_9PEZI|nr:uncharacterized protein B0T26DRAFT_720272 [Lasiosphaeria miniovina]KAK0709049.1 hypothetical protein B0T26DRAFT_720272 [Lasiosphaeria miniovina]